MPTIQVSLTDRSYAIEIGRGLLTDSAARVATWTGRESSGTALLVSDENVVETYGSVVAASLQEAGWRVDVATLVAGEQSKSLEVTSDLYDRLVELPADRGSVVVAVGGGVVGDVAGFAAATFARGIALVQVPTTLLAQVDSSVGGKVAVNHPRAKNLVGAFHQPAGVLIDTDTLDSLPDRDYRAGLAEVVKYGVILDAEFFGYLESHVEDLLGRDAEVLGQVIGRCCRLKADVVEADERETTGLRAVLNYGHTFGHAHEVLAGYGELLHGEAVAIGMIQASRLAERLGRIDAEVTGRQVELLERLGLPVAPPETADTDAVLERMQLDKKTQDGQLRFVLPTRLGHVELVSPVDPDQVRSVLDPPGAPGSCS